MSRFFREGGALCLSSVTIATTPSPTAPPSGVPEVHAHGRHGSAKGLAALAEEGGRTKPANENALMVTAIAIAIVCNVSRWARKGTPCALDIEVFS